MKVNDKVRQKFCITSKNKPPKNTHMNLKFTHHCISQSNIDTYTVKHHITRFEKCDIRINRQRNVFKKLVKAFCTVNSAYINSPSLISCQLIWIITLFVPRCVVIDCSKKYALFESTTLFSYPISFLCKAGFYSPCKAGFYSIPRNIKSKVNRSMNISKSVSKIIQKFNRLKYK